MPERTITLLTTQDSLAPVEGLAGALVEYAADAPWLPAECVPVTELLGPWEVAKQRAAALVLELLDGEPAIDGVRHLYALKEILIRAAMQHQLTLHLDGWLRTHRIERCIFRAYSPFSEALKQVQDFTESRYEITAPAPPKRSRLEDAREHFHLKGTAGLRDLPWLAAQQLFPLRARLLQRHSAGLVSPEEWWYYSTFYTFTNIGFAYERALGRQFRFVTELRGSAEKPLKQAGRDWDDLYSFAEREDVPSKKDIEAAQKKLREYLESAKTQDATAKQLLLRSRELREFFARLLPLTLLQTRALQRWVSKAQPELIVVGNEAWEGCLLQLARARGIPTIVLQHGILGDFYQITAHSGDVIVVRGEFWKEFLSETSRKRSVVLNCDPPKMELHGGHQGSDLLFATTDYRPQPFWHPADLNDMLAAAATAAFEAKRRLVIRTHPRDSAEVYKNALERICQELRIAPDVAFSSGPGLDEAIGNSAVVLLYFSTIFLDCLKIGVPVVSPDWHHFAFKDMVRRHGVFQFAHDLKDLRRLLADGLSHGLPVNKSYEQFLAQTPAEELRKFFEQHAATSKVRQ